MKVHRRLCRWEDSIKENLKKADVNGMSWFRIEFIEELLLALYV